MINVIFVFNSILGTASHRHRVRDAAQIGHGSLTFRWRLNSRVLDCECFAAFDNNGFPGVQVELLWTRIPQLRLTGSARRNPSVAKSMGLAVQRSKFNVQR
jgi:hypothetical protein